MKENQLKALSRILIAGLFLIMITASALLVFALGDDTTSQAQPQVRQAPINPEYIRYMYRLMAGEPMIKFTKDGHALGLIPSPLDPAIFSPENGIERAGLIQGFPAIYDLRPLNKVTPIKNQGSCGSCWSFAAFGSLESFLKPLVTWDFSEQHLIENHGFDKEECAGGSFTMAAAYFEKWAGPGLESSLPYEYYSLAGIPIKKHVQKIIMYPDRASSLDNARIKDGVTRYGAVTVSMSWVDAAYKSATASYYNGTTIGTGHAVCVVGWDDNYSKFNFATVPAGNGAFLVRNSWGTGWGMSGYFYVSYYDRYFGRQNDGAVVFTAEPVTNYRANYGWDELGWCGNFGFTGTQTGWMANIFKATTTGFIKAVGFYAAANSNVYEIYVYTNITAGKPTSGTKFTKVKMGTIAGRGYQTIPLGFLVPITQGKLFSVVVKLKTTGYNYPIPFERRITGYSSLAKFTNGQSFASYNGSSWTQLNVLLKDPTFCNVCLRAYTKY